MAEGKLYYAFSDAGTHPMIPHRFREDGSIDVAVIRVLKDQQTPPIVTDVITSSVFELDPNWETNWKQYSDCPHGAHLYVDPARFADNPIKISSELSAAHRRRDELMHEANPEPVVETQDDQAETDAQRKARRRANKSK